MMRKTKTFDCVEMKTKIQEKHAREFAGLPDHEIAAQMVRELETSKDPVAASYRECLTRESVAAAYGFSVKAGGPGQTAG